MSANQEQPQTTSNEVPNTGHNQGGAGDASGSQHTASDNGSFQQGGSTGYSIDRYVTQPIREDHWTEYSYGQHQSN